MLYKKMSVLMKHRAVSASIFDHIIQIHDLSVIDAVTIVHIITKIIIYLMVLLRVQSELR